MNFFPVFNSFKIQFLLPVFTLVPSHPTAYIIVPKQIIFIYPNSMLIYIIILIIQYLIYQ